MCKRLSARPNRIGVAVLVGASPPVLSASLHHPVATNWHTCHLFPPGHGLR